MSKPVSLSSSPSPISSDNNINKIMNIVLENPPSLSLSSDQLTHSSNALHSLSDKLLNKPLIVLEFEFLQGKVVSLNKQIGNFERVTLPELEIQLRRPRREILRNYLFFIAAGNNDYLLNYFLGGSLIYTPEEFAKKLISNYSSQLQKLYKLGARKFLLMSVYPLGCSPMVTNVVNVFYNNLKPFVNQLNLRRQMPSSVIIVANSVKIISIIDNAVNGTCCKQNGSICDNKNYTEALSSIVADKIYNSNDNSEIYPVNLRKLVLAHP